MHVNQFADRIPDFKDIDIVFRTLETVQEERAKMLIAEQSLGQTYFLEIGQLRISDRWRPASDTGDSELKLKNIDRADAELQTGQIACNADEQFHLRRLLSGPYRSLHDADLKTLGHLSMNYDPAKRVLLGKTTSFNDKKALQIEGNDLGTNKQLLHIFFDQEQVERSAYQIMFKAPKETYLRYYKQVLDALRNARWTKPLPDTLEFGT